MNNQTETYVWKGEGLPPVGTVCQYTLGDSNCWYECSVSYIPDLGVYPKQHLVIYCPHLNCEQIVGVSIGILNRAKFRPIRTNEQIAAEERGVVYKQMVDDLIEELGLTKINGERCETMHALVARDYRKQGEVLVILKDLIHAYPKASGMDGAFNPELVKAEAFLKSFEK